MTLKQRTLLVFCGDNGVVSQGVSQSDASVTTAVASALGPGRQYSELYGRSCGLQCTSSGCWNEGTDTPRRTEPKNQPWHRGYYPEACYDPEECLAAVEVGVKLVEEQAKNGTDILLLGEMGIGNTTTSAAVASVLLGCPPEQLTGRGAGLSDAGLRRKLRAVRQAIAAHGPDPEDPIDVLAKVGGLDLAALCGAALGGAKYRIPVLLDGVITNTAALCAVRLCPAVKDALIASHVSEEPAAGRLLDAMGLRPCISAGLHLGEGSGAVLALPLLDQALAVYNSGHTFDVLGIAAYMEM